MKRVRTTAILAGAVMMMGLGGCAEYYGHGYGDRGRQDCRDADRDRDGHCVRHDDRRDNDHHDGGYNEPH